MSKVQYPMYWGSLSLTPQYKFMILRSVDRERDVRLQSEYRSVPILRLEYPLLRRTSLAAGIQGIGPVPYLRENHADTRLSFEQRTFFVSLRNRSKYFGYDLVTIVGFNKHKVSFENISQKDRDTDLWSFFVRTVVGFTEFGRGALSVAVAPVAVKSTVTLRQPFSSTIAGQRVTGVSP